MKRRSVVFVALVCVVVIALAIFVGERRYRNYVQNQDGGDAAQAQRAQNAGSAPTYH